MEENNKMITYAVVALVVGVLVGAGIGYAVFHDNSNSDDETYYYYIYFGENDSSNGWYSATGTDAGNAFEKAMDNAGFDYEISSSGYISSIDNIADYWMTYQYLYSDYTSTAASASILYPSHDSYETFEYSNGWKAVAGYDDSSVSFKMSEIDSTVFLISVYTDGVAPDTYDGWMSGGPF